MAVDKCVWESAARSSPKAQALLNVLFVKGAKLVVDDGCEYCRRLWRRLEGVRHSCAGSIAHLLNLVFRSRNLVDYRAPVDAEDAPRGDRLIAGLAVVADVLITEDERLWGGWSARGRGPRRSTKPLNG